MKHTIKQIIEQCGGTTALSQHCKTQQQTMKICKNYAESVSLYEKANIFL